MLNVIRKALGLRTHHRAVRVTVEHNGERRAAAVIDPNAHVRVLVG